MKKCTKCRSDKDLDNFTIDRSRPDRRADRCKSCQKEARQINYSADIRAKNNRRVKAWHAAQPVEYLILKNTKKSDKLNELENDLTREFIYMMISVPCAYCGEDKGRLTLDRINNALGHLQSNVTTACLRCNYIRRDMPYEAWIEIAPAIKIARISGLFGDWDGAWESRGKMEGKLDRVRAPLETGAIS